MNEAREITTTDVIKNEILPTYNVMPAVFGFAPRNLRIAEIDEHIHDMSIAIHDFENQSKPSSGGRRSAPGSMVSHPAVQGAMANVIPTKGVVADGMHRFNSRRIILSARSDSKINLDLTMDLWRTGEMSNSLIMSLQFNTAAPDIDVPIKGWPALTLVVGPGGLIINDIVIQGVDKDSIDREGRERLAKAKKLSQALVPALTPKALEILNSLKEQGATPPPKSNNHKVVVDFAWGSILSSIGKVAAPLAVNVIKRWAS